MTRVFVVGATSAIATATTALFARDGARLHLVARDARALDDARENCLRRGAAAVSVDVADLADIDILPVVVARADAALGGFDVTLVCHGVLPRSPPPVDDPDALANLALINFVSPAALVEHAAKVHVRERTGVIVLVGSVAGDRGRAGNYAYGATKAAIATFASGLRDRVAFTGVRVVLVKPGFIISPMTAHLRAPPFAALPASIAPVIHRAAIRGSPATLYTPAVWRLIMLVVRMLPAAVMRRLPI